MTLVSVRARTNWQCGGASVALMHNRMAPVSRAQISRRDSWKSPWLSCASSLKCLLGYYSLPRYSLGCIRIGHKALTALPRNLGRHLLLLLKPFEIVNTWYWQRTPYPHEALLRCRAHGSSSRQSVSRTLTKDNASITSTSSLHLNISPPES